MTAQEKTMKVRERILLTEWEITYLNSLIKEEPLESLTRHYYKTKLKHKFTQARLRIEQKQGK